MEPEMLEMRTPEVISNLWEQYQCGTIDIAFQHEHTKLSCTVSKRQQCLLNIQDDWRKQQKEKNQKKRKKHFCRYPFPVVCVATFSRAVYLHSYCAIALLSLADRPSFLPVKSFVPCICISHTLRIRAWASEIEVRFEFCEAIRSSIVAWYDSLARKRAISHSSYLIPFASGIILSCVLFGGISDCTTREKDER